MPRAHRTFAPTGSGKSTFAMGLSSALPALLFALGCGAPEPAAPRTPVAALQAPSLVAPPPPSAPPVAAPVAMPLLEGSVFERPAQLIGHNEDVSACFSGDSVQATVYRNASSHWVSWSPPYNKPQTRAKWPQGVLNAASISCAPSGEAVGFMQNDDAYFQMHPRQPSIDSMPPASYWLKLGDAATGTIRDVHSKKVARVRWAVRSGAGVSNVDFSSDGTRFAYVRYGARHTNDRVTDVHDTATLQLLGSHPGRVDAWDGDALVLWTPDGNHRVRWQPGAAAVPYEIAPSRVANLDTDVSPGRRWRVQRGGVTGAPTLTITDTHGKRPPITFDVRAMFPKYLAPVFGTWLSEDELVLEDWVIMVSSRQAQRLFPQGSSSFRAWRARADAQILLAKELVDPMERQFAGLYLARRR